MRLPAENIKTAREVQLVDFLNTYRPGELVRKSRDEYCTKSHSSLRITPSKNLSTGAPRARAAEARWIIC